MTSKFIKLLVVVGLLLASAASVMAEADDVVITTSGREVNLCTHESQTLKVYVGDTTGEITSFCYQWYYSDAAVFPNDTTGWVMIPGADSSALVLSNVSADTTMGNAGYYYCRVSFGFNCMSSKNSERIVVKVLSGAPTIGSISLTTDNSVCEGTPINIHADNVTGYQLRRWLHNGEVVSYGGSYYIGSTTVRDAGEYIFVASNACGETTMSGTLNVEELPRIATQPRSAGICEGEDLHFVVVATGSNLQYQWYYNNAPYSAANGSDTNDTLVIAQAVHDPSTYSNTFCVQVSNSCATVTSINVGTIISEMPTIVGNPLSGNYCNGVEVTLTADATTSYPTDTLTYQWFLNGDVIEGATSDIISFAMDSAHMGEFYCKFTNGCGTVVSNSALLYVKMGPVIEGQPIDASVCEGDATQLFAKIVGEEPITYAWLKDNGADPVYTDITMPNVSGNTTSTLVINPASETHEHFYFCYASNECGEVRTDTVFVTVNQQITVYPPLATSFIACSGADTSLSVINNIYEGTVQLGANDFEEAGVTFAWHRHGETEVIAEGPVLHFAGLQDTDNGYYVCDVTNSCGTVSEGPIFVSVLASPNITVQPHDIDVCTGGPAFTVSLTAEGDQLRYSWYRNGVYIGTNAPSYTAPTVAQQYAGEYYCVVASEQGCPTVYSDTITVSVGTTPAISWQPTPNTVAICEGEPYALRMRATGEGIHYQWYNNGIAVPGQTTDSLYIAHVTRNNTGEFYCIVSNACAEIPTEHAHLTVNNAPDMTLGPDINACRGQSVVLGPQGDAEYGHYSWNYGTYGYQPTLTVTLGGTYFLEVSDSAHGNCVARDTVRVVYHDYFDIAFDSTPIVTCGEFLLDAGAGAAEYQWSTTDITSSITVGMNGYYMVTVDGDGYGCTTSAGVNVTIGEAIEISLGDDITISEDSIVEIGVPAIFQSYMWNTGYTGPRLTVEGSEYGVGLHTFWIEVSNGMCSARDSLTINFLEAGIEEETLPTLSVYPNPANDHVNIVSANGAMNQIQIFDIMGRLIRTEVVDSEFVTLDVASMVDATYFVRIVYSDGNSSVSKLIINR
ncbi:MAG: immunoglobulin domain-containing protein [Bacteroidales bacterium]|nr:immunoglobulin domain-containing protein [Bacteroidales bacterium]